MSSEDVQQAVKEAKELIKMLESSSVSRMQLITGNFKILVERKLAQASGAVAPPSGASAAATGDGLYRVLSPMVGTFYHSSSPGEAPFVEVGARVQRGQKIGIVEAMKVMNEISSDASGVVVEILVGNGQAVEFEQPLIAIDTKG